MAIDDLIYRIAIFSLFAILGLILSFITNKILKNILKKLTLKTKTKLDDILYSSLELPIYIFIISTFIYFGIFFLPIQQNILILITNGYKALTIILFTLFLYKLVDSIINCYVEPYIKKTDSKLDDHIIVPLKKLIKLLIIIFGILFALSSVGYDITALLAGLGIGGLAIALAMQDVIKNFIAGILIYVDKPFIIGHWIKVDNFEGIVEEIGLRTTKIRSFDYSLIIVPNSKILEAEIENFSVRDRRRVLVTIGLTYSTPPEKIKMAIEIIKRIIEEHPATLPPYRVHFVEYGDWSLNLRVEYYIRNMGFDYYLNALSDINLKIKEEFNKKNIEMAFPTYSIYIEKDN